VVKVLVLVIAAMPALVAAAESQVSGSVTGYYYAMRNEPDFGVGVAALDYGSLHFEGRYNYEVHNAGSAFVGWKLTGGETITFEVTPIVGVLFGAGRGVVPGVEASVAWSSFDAYLEAEYVDDRANPGSSYYYTWGEVAWNPYQWLRVGLVGQRTHTVDVGREYERGLFAQVTVERVTFSIYAFNPDSSVRYVIASLGMRF